MRIVDSNKMCEECGRAPETTLVSLDNEVKGVCDRCAAKLFRRRNPEYVCDCPNCGCSVAVN